jgi:hypothetical protein
MSFKRINFILIYLKHKNFNNLTLLDLSGKFKNNPNNFQSILILNDEIKNKKNNLYQFTWTRQIYNKSHEIIIIL